MLLALLEVIDDESYVLSVMEILEDKIQNYLLYTKPATKLYIECVK